MTHEELVRELAGLSKAGAPDPKSGFELPSSDTFAPEEVFWLWPGYLRRAQLTMLDARGGAGKTTFALAVAACGSNGFLPFNGETEKFRTLIIGNEDSGSDLQAVYHQLEGQPKFMFPWVNSDLILTEEGCERLKNTILVNRIDFVVLDPGSEFLPADVKTTFATVPIRQTMSRLRRVAMETHAAVLIIRHWASSTLGKHYSSFGEGGDIWRNCARGQLVMIEHPTENGKGIVIPAKGNIRGALAPAFGYKRSVDGIFGFVSPDDLDLEPYDSILSGKGPAQKPGKAGRPEKMDEICETIAQLLEGKSLYIKDLRAKLQDIVECSDSSFYSAKRKLKLIDNKGMMSMPAEFDPFDEPYWVK